MGLIQSTKAPTGSNEMSKWSDWQNKKSADICRNRSTPQLTLECIHPF